MAQSRAVAKAALPLAGPGSFGEKSAGRTELCSRNRLRTDLTNSQEVRLSRHLGRNFSGFLIAVGQLDPLCFPIACWAGHEASSRNARKHVR